MLWVDKYRPNSLEKVIYTLIEYEILVRLFFLFVGVNSFVLAFGAIAPKLTELSINSVLLVLTHGSLDIGELFLFFRGFIPSYLPLI